jgi:hypothetical protein
VACTTPLARGRLHGWFDFLTFDLDHSLVGRVDAGDNFTERTFARAVFAHHRVHRGFFKFNRNIVEGAYPGEGLGNVFDRQESRDDSVVLGLQFGG